jgi:enoyl-CoA hydratase
MAYEFIQLAFEDTVAIVTINRPKALNALNVQVLEELKGAIGEVRNHAQARVVILTGAGEKAFVAGADIAQMANMTPEEGLKFAELGNSTLLALEELPQPVIAAVNGFALGGGTELAIACDMIFASTNAKMGQPEVNLGIIPGFGGTQRLPRLLGKNLAKWIIFTGDMVDAQRAKEIGLVIDVFPPESLMENVKQIARKIAGKGPLAIAAAKRAIDKGFNRELRDGLGVEAEQFSGLFASDDKKEGMTAFLEKRKAQFTGK